jgi:hypothetical protein
MLIPFVQFWLLTKIIPYRVILLLIPANALGLLVVTLLGAITGFSTKENQKKIETLSLISGFLETAQSKPKSLVYMLMGWLILLSWGSSLWIYWNPPKEQFLFLALLIALIFFVTTITGMILNVFASYSLVVSEYIDNDLRNSFISTQFSSILHSTILLLWPVWFFSNELKQTLIQLPPTWVILSLPLLVFLLGSLFPFFVGLYRYKNRNLTFLRSRLKHIETIYKHASLPVGEPRTKLLMEDLNAIGSDIESLANDNEWLKIYSSLGTSESEFDEAREIFEFILKNKENITKWDIRFAHVKELRDLYTSISDNLASDIKGYTKSNLETHRKQIANFDQSKNQIAGFFIALFIAIIPFLLKVFESDITDLLKRLS